MVRATALRKLRGSKVSLNKHELEVLAQQIKADLHRIDGDGAGTAPGSHRSSETAHECHDGHGQETCARNPAERHTAGGNEKNPDGTARGSRTGSGQVRVARSKDSPQGATLRRPANDVENLRVPMKSLPHRTGQEVSRASGENRRPHQRCSKHRLRRREPRTEHAAVFRPGPRDAKGKCGRVDREEREPRRRRHGLETDPGRVRLDRAGKRSRHVVQTGQSPVSSGIRHRRWHQQDGRGHDQVSEDGRRNLSDTIKRGILMKALANETELQKHVFRNSTRLDTYAKMRQEVMSALTAERAVHEPMGDDPMEIGAVGKSGKKGKGKKGKGKNDQKGGGKGPGQGKGTGTPNPHADRECFYCHRKGHIKEECRFRIADEKDSKSRDEKDKRKDKRSKQRDKKRVNALEGNQGMCGNNNSQGQVQATVGSLQTRMIFAVRATHGTTTNSSELADGDIPERMRLTPLRNALMLDSGAQVSAVPRQQIDELHYNPGPSNVTGLKGISGGDIPRYGHVELNLRRGQDVVQVGAEVADIEHGIIATDAIVMDGTLEPPSQTTAIKLRTHQANYYLEFDEILKQDETNQGQSVAAVRRGYRTRQPAEASQGTLPRTMGLESDEQTTLPTRTLKSPGQPSVEEKTAHEMHHLPYRLWCPECVEARGVDDPHHRQPALDELATPKVTFDIFFVGPDEIAKMYKIVNGCFNLRDKERFLSSHELDQTIAVLNWVDCKTNAQGTLLANMELDKYKVNYIVAMLDYWGHTTVILQTD